MKCTENHQSTNCWVEGSEKVYFLFLFRGVVVGGGMGGKKWEEFLSCIKHI
jgi:hypothetical protein